MICNCEGVRGGGGWGGGGARRREGLYSTDNHFIGWRPVASFTASLENITRHAQLAGELLEDRET